MLAHRYLLYILLAVSIFFNRAAAQQSRYGNEWINYEQTYVKIPVWENGLYRISYDQLQKAGFPIDKNPRSYQLFKQGSEQAILVAGEQDGKFDTADYIEFFGIPNDGSRDAELYRNPAMQTNPKVSLFSDTTHYFLTVRLDNGVGKRMETVAQQAQGSLQAEPFHWEETLSLFKSWYASGPTYPLGVRYMKGMLLSNYEVGKGYIDNSINNGGNRNYSLGYTNAVKTADKPKLEISIYGETPDPHVVEIKGGTSQTQNRLLSTLNFASYGLPLFEKELEWTDLSTTTLFVNISSVKGSVSTETIAPVYLKLSYPQRLTMQNLTAGKRLRLRANTAGTSFIQITEATSADRIFDVTNPDQVQRIESSFANAVVSAVVPQTATARQLWVSRTSRAVSKVQRIGFRKIDPTKHNYLIVTDKRLQKPAGPHADIVKAYAGYRASAIGGKHDTLVVDVDMLANQFNYGERGVLAIRHFANYMVQNGTPNHLFLMGKGIVPQYFRFISNMDQYNLVPVGGWPGSDLVTIQGLKGGKDMPALPIGRLSVATPADVLIYFNKVKEYEAEAPALWKKSFLHLSGGKSTSELSTFRNYVDRFGTIAKTGNTGARISTISKKTDNPVETINISRELNQGVGLITMFGHSSSQVSDIDIGYVSNDELGYRNKGKYPIIIINGCEAGNIFDYNLPKEPLSTDWVNTADRGAILVLATSFLGFPSYLDAYTTNAYNELFQNELSLGKSFGTSLVNSIRAYLTKYSDEMAIGHAQQFVLQGDPAIVPFPYTKPDYAIANSNLFLKNFSGKEITATDSFQVGMIISNLGRTLKKPFSVTLKRTLSNGKEINLGSRSYAPVAYQDTLYFTVKNTANGGGINRFDVIIDEKQEIDELSKQNNAAFFSLALPGSLARPLIPHDFAIVGTQENNTPTVRLVAEFTPTAATAGSSTILFELDTAASFNSAFKKTTTLPASNADGWKVSLLSTDSTVYHWRVRDGGLAQNATNEWATYSFTYIKGVQDGWAQRKSTQFESVITDNVTLQNSRWQFSGTATSGTLTSPLIGPSNRWGVIRRQVNKTGQQTSLLDVYGIDANGNETLLMNNLTVTVINISSINVKQYPMLRLREKIAGSAAPQLKQWLVSYDPVPEGALRVQGQTNYRSNIAVSMDEGAAFTQNLTFDVVSTNLFTDSLVVNETISSVIGQTTRQYKVASAKSIPLKLSYPSLVAGENQIFVSVNPQVLPEVNYTNNTLTYVVNVQPDRTAPILEVTFDGKTIQNEEFVSPNPVIQVRIKDTNPYFIKKDTVGVSMYLQRADTTLQRIWLTKNPLVTLTPSNENDFRITYKPATLKEGLYQFQVQASDVAGNNAGAYPYTVRFRVNAESSLQQFVVSPNPLSHFTRFSFLIAGSSIPDEMAIEIYSLQGQLLRIISNEKQPLQIGKTDYFWNGSDQQGNLLPAGTYIYKVKLNKQGQPFAPVEPGFKTTGRIVIVR